MRAEEKRLVAFGRKFGFHQLRPEPPSSAQFGYFLPEFKTGKSR
jgi:hypothetical protein